MAHGEFADNLEVFFLAVGFLLIVVPILIGKVIKFMFE
jgi:hypothetical protein